jgi:hypothetical protein
MLIGTELRKKVIIFKIEFSSFCSTLIFWIKVQTFYSIETDPIKSQSEMYIEKYNAENLKISMTCIMWKSHSTPPSPSSTDPLKLFFNRNLLVWGPPSITEQNI